MFGLEENIAPSTVPPLLTIFTCSDADLLTLEVWKTCVMGGRTNSGAAAATILIDL
jgi:hypothetical protein